jgi:hypothetical protein
MHEYLILESERSNEWKIYKKIKPLNPREHSFKSRDDLLSSRDDSFNSRIHMFNSRDLL